MPKLAATAAMAALLSCASAAQAGEFIEFDPLDAVQSYVAGIGQKGNVAGDYDDGLDTHVFVRTRAGKSKSIADLSVATIVKGMNRHNQITGSVDDNGFAGFIFDAKGHQVTFRGPDSGTSGLGTQAQSINDGGVVTGFYASEAANVAHGFLRDTAGNLATFDVPGAGLGDREGTYPRALTDRGMVVGEMLDDSAAAHGFVRMPNGKVKIVDFDDAQASASFQGVFLTCANDKGDAAGYYDTAAGGRRGFLRVANGHVETFDLTGPVTVRAISSHDTVAGSYAAGGLTHGFVRSADGTVTTLDAPHAVKGTFVQALNDKGWAAGYYDDAQGIHHSFIWKP